MKLYRGLRTDEYEEFDLTKFQEYQSAWNFILKNRSQGNFEYPQGLNQIIGALQQNNGLNRQYFTDNKEVAYRYAKTQKGIVVEIDVSTTDIIKYFQLEFQNFAKRKTAFEIVYSIDALTLSKHNKDWQLTIIQPQS